MDHTPPRHPSTLHRLAVIGLAGAVLLSGCAGSRLTEDDPVVRTAVAEAAVEVRAARTDVVDVLYGAGSIATVIATADDEACAEGQHNWKIDDPYDVTCTATSSVIVELPDGAGLDELQRLHRMLTEEAGAVAVFPSEGLAAIAAEYGHGIGRWDDRPGLDGDPVPYGIEHFPGASYRRDGLEVGIGFTGPNDRWRHRHGTAWLAPDGTEIASSTLVESLQPDRVAVIVAVHRRLDL